MHAVLTVTRRALLVAAALAALAAPGAVASPPPPIVRPPGEAKLAPDELGRQLFAGNCARCHGSRGEGVTSRSGDQGPPLIGVGRLATDFYLRTGYMPLDHVPDQPERHRVLFRDDEVRAIEDYVDSLTPAPGPPIPKPDPGAGSVSQGLQLFTEHCSGCHQVVAEGGVVTGARVPPLDQATPVQVAQAVRIGPYVMPKFDRKDITDGQLNSIVRYVQYAQDPDDRGGWGIGHLGPFPEGLITWFIAGLLIVVLCVVIGERARRRA
jgi:ubiquinol-cytochrome c reductase cytochrome c subunit